ncbi:hypothetical protein H4219_004568 [Mycoemilia scoparia]|uniref:MINDY deubiquitinase domain-containing protein n=1 Tax=Mycoemilia scoparia TaxID=417184 RepID=A0A9W7ZR83_9FUNG|nr:hypothetical protein H4219_004568 [Mycoemilia scoparia]
MSPTSNVLPREKQEPGLLYDKNSSERIPEESLPETLAYSRPEQQKNGPCPLIALLNVLILRGDIQLGQTNNAKSIGNERAVALLADYILSQHHLAKTASEEDIDELLKLIPTLCSGLDVNVRFSSNFGFDTDTPASRLFRACKVDLVHGWVVDPENEARLAKILRENCRDNYEGAVEFIVNSDRDSQGHVVRSTESPEANNSGNSQAVGSPKAGCSKDSSPVNQDTVSAALLVGQFLENTASQLTEYGLSTLSIALPDNHLCVLFRNNHFSTLFKRHDNELFMLCTDYSVANDRRIVWETLGDIYQGTSTFLNSNFVHYSNDRSSTSPGAATTNSSNNNNNGSRDGQNKNGSTGSAKYYSNADDYLHEVDENGGAVSSSADNKEQMDQDYALALALQEEEQERANGESRRHHQQQQQQQHRQSQHHSNNNRRSRQYSASQRALQYRQEERLPPGYRQSRDGGLYGVPEFTDPNSQAGREQARNRKSGISDEEFNRRMTETFLPNEAQSGSIQRGKIRDKFKKGKGGICTIC